MNYPNIPSLPELNVVEDIENIYIQSKQYSVGPKTRLAISIHLANKSLSQLSNNIIYTGDE